MQSSAAPDALREVAGTPFRLAVYDSVEAAEMPWRALEQTAVLTPYQRYDWIKPLLDSRPLDGGRCAIAIVHDASGPVALFPFAVVSHLGVKVASIIGSDIGNADWLIMHREAAAQLTPAVLTRLFAEAGGQVGGIDVVVLNSQPASWLGLANPLMGFLHQPAPDHLYIAPVTPEGETGRLSHKHFRNIQRGKRRLEETFGPVALRSAGSIEEIARVHATFVEQRNVRFAQMGIPNLFADDWFVDFFKRAAAVSLGSDRPALRFHALYAGDEIVATACGAYCGSHYSQYINSTASGPAAKYSLIGILLHQLIAELATKGITSIDMGLGDFDYKADWTDKQEVFDGAIGVTPVGKLAARVILGLRGLKRSVKQNPRLFGMFKRLRAITVKGNQPKADTPPPDNGEVD